MPHRSDPRFQTFHALRIKGFAKSDTLAEIADLPVEDVDVHLAQLQASGFAAYREARGLWQLTPDGRSAHAIELAADVTETVRLDLHPLYERFLELNHQFKNLCGDWQLRDGSPNDHSDASYDAVVIERLVDLDGRAAPIVEGMGDVLGRLGPYAPRLEATRQRVVDGEINLFTGVMCGSYHDVWMELHEDLLLTQGLDRAKEGSF
jgi:hypothetical protein